MLHSAPAGQFGDAIQFFIAIVGAFEQRPLILNRIAGRACVPLAELHEFGGIDRAMSEDCAKQVFNPSISDETRPTDGWPGLAKFVRTE